jgi:hypothetical protein
MVISEMKKLLRAAQRTVKREIRKGSSLEEGKKQLDKLLINPKR